MMADLNTELVRVAASPYAVSLKSLSDILEKATSKELHEWAEVHPCQASPLAVALVNALEFCPFAQGVFERLGKVTAIRNAILRCRKTILDVVLKSALSNEKYFQKYSPMCLSLLSTPLPADIPTPALLGNFFLRWVEVATTNPTPDSIRPIYTLAASGYSHLIQCLAPAQRAMLFGRLGKFLYEVDQTVVLLSLATLAHFNSPSTADMSEKSIRNDLFNGKKTEKLLGLICMNVISAASAGSGTWEEAVEKIRLAMVVLEAIDAGTKEAYVHSPKSAQIVGNLMGKMVKPELNREVLAELVNFCVVISPMKPLVGLTEFVHKLLKQALQEGGNAGQLQAPVSISECVGDILAINCSEEIIRGLLLNTLTLCTTPLPADITNHFRLKYHLASLTSIFQKLPSSPILRTTLLSCLLTNEFTKPLHRFFITNIPTPKTVDCTSSEVCGGNIWGLQRELASKACVVLLTAGFYTSSDNVVRLDPNMATSLLALNGTLSSSSSMSSFSCSAGMPHPSHHQVIALPTTISMIEQAGTPNVRLNSNNWRDRLATELHTDANRQHQAIINAVGEICRDLEVRCEGIEKPLRDEQEKSARLKAEIEEWRDRCTQLQGLVERRNEMINDLEEEKERLEKQLDLVMEKGHEAEVTIGGLEKLLEEARSDITSVREEAKGEADRVAAGHLSILTDRQEKLAELEDHNGRLEQEIDILREDLESVTRAKMEANERIEWLDGELSKAVHRAEVHEQESGRRNQQIQEKNDAILEKCRNIDNLEATINERDIEIKKQMVSLATAVEESSKLKTQIAKIEVANITLTANLESLQTAMKKLKEESKKDYDALKAENANTTSKLNHTHEKEILNLQSLLQKTRNDWVNEREHLYSEKRTLEKKYAKLHTISEKRTREFSEATELSKKLMATIQAVGLLESSGNEPPSPEPPCNAASLSLSMETPLPKNYNQKERRQSAFPPTVARTTTRRRRTELQQDPKASTSTPSPGPTPKRTRITGMVSLHRNPTNQKQTLTTMNCGFKTVKSGSLFPNQNRKLGGEDEKENLSSDDPTGSLDGMGIGMGDFSDVLYTSTPKQQQQQQQQHHPQMQFPQFPKSTAGEDEMQQDRDGEGSFAEFDGGIEDSFEDIQDEEAGVDIMRVMVDEETTMGY